jgi:hypothetical protein
MKAASLSALLMISGCVTQDDLKESLPGTYDKSSQNEIFRAVLQDWLDRNERGNSIYVSKYTFSVPESELQKFTACANNEVAKIVTLTLEPSTKVSAAISDQRLHFINRRFWLTPNPNRISKIIEEGRPAGILSFSNIAFDADKSVAVLHFSLTCGSLCGYGETLVLDRTVSGWVPRQTRCDAWMS